MLKQGRQTVLLLFLTLGLSGCVSSLWTGASLFYDRHNVYKKIDDYQTYINVNNALFFDKIFKNQSCILDIVVFHGDILVVGHLPSMELMNEFNKRMRTIEGRPRFYNEVKLANLPSNNPQDTWITAKIRSQVLADSSIDPNSFKVVTTDRVVYLIGEMKQDEADKLILIARSTNGVDHVVKILKYFTYQQGMRPDNNSNQAIS